MTSHELTTAEFDNAQDITRLRGDLADSLYDALTALTTANRSIDDLTSPHVFDGEYADTTVGEDVRAAVLDSARQLRAAAALVAQVGP